MSLNNLLKTFLLNRTAFIQNQANNVANFVGYNHHVNALGCLALGQPLHRPPPLFGALLTQHPPWLRPPHRALSRFAAHQVALGAGL